MKTLGRQVRRNFKRAKELLVKAAEETADADAKLTAQKAISLLDAKLIQWEKETKR